MSKRDHLNKNTLFLEFSWKLRKLYKKTFEELGEKFQLSQNEIDVLLFLHNNAPLDTARDIARYRAMSKSMISRSVTALEKKDYIYSEPDQEDKRCLHLRISSNARVLIEELSGAQKEFLGKLNENISREESRAVEIVLNKLHENIDSQLDNLG